MCGIFGYVGNKKNAPEIVLKGLRSLEYRGYDSWGIAAVKYQTDAEKEISKETPCENMPKDLLLVSKKTGKIGEARIDNLPTSSFAFGHTRWATHGGVTDENAHPHLDCKKNIAIIHNGIIENFESLKKNLIKKGHKFRSETDSEVAAHMIEENCKKYGFTKAVQKTFLQLKGLNALIALNTRDYTLAAVRNGSPLVVGFSDTANYIASDAAALIPHTKQVHYLEDDEMAILENDKIKIFDTHSGDRIRPKKQQIDWTVEEAEKGQYDYYMLKEIHEQPGVIADIAVNSAKYAEKTAKILKKAKSIHLVGCGTAAYACIAGQYLFSKIANKKVRSCIGSEFTYQSDFLNDKSVVVALSQSGETMDTLEAVRFAKKKGATIIALVNVLGSSLYRMADHKLLISAGPEKGVASTKAFMGKLAHLIMLAFALKGETKQGQDVLLKAAKECKRIMSDNSIPLIKNLAKQVSKNHHIYAIGRGLSYPAALEAALKIKEISYIHAEGFAGGELKHGVIALVEKNTPCIAYMPKDETYGDTLSGAMEMRARGGYIIGISNKDHEVIDYHIPVRNMGVATIMPNVVAAQLLAYYLTLERGFDPDMPRNLAKSVTVK